MKKVLFTFLAAFLLAVTPSIGQKTLIYCGHLIDTDKGTLSKDMTIVVETNKITQVVSGFTTPEDGDEVIDLKNKYVLPGLIDMHVHLESETGKENQAMRQQFGEADTAYEAEQHAKTTLMAGFTTVRDLGGSGVNIALRNAINRGWVVGPRILTSGRTVSTTGGHGDPTNGMNPRYQLKDAERADGVINSADEARKVIRKRYQDGADWVKITATGGVLSIAKSGQAPLFQDDELKALVETAKDYDIEIAAHAHGTEGIKRALRAGVRTVEHGTYMDDEAIRLFKEKDAYFVPTIIAGMTVSDSAKVKGYYHPYVVAKALGIGPIMQETFAKAYKAGVNIAFGTDAGVFTHGMNAKEFLYMTEAGMPVMAALKSATVTNAKVLKMDDKVGKIAPGMLADIIAVDENPETDISTLMNVSFVMKDGKVYKQ